MRNRIDSGEERQSGPRRTEAWVWDGMGWDGMVWPGLVWSAWLRRIGFGLALQGGWGGETGVDVVFSRDGKVPLKL